MYSLVDPKTNDNLDINIIAHDMNPIITISS